MGVKPMTNISSKKKNTPCLKCDIVDHDTGLCECPCHPTHEEIMTKPMKANTPTRKLIAKIVKKVLKEYKLTFKLLGKND